jgi:hypothetical protein
VVKENRGIHHSLRELPVPFARLTALTSAHDRLASAFGSARLVSTAPVAAAELAPPSVVLPIARRAAVPLTVGLRDVGGNALSLLFGASGCADREHRRAVADAEYDHDD